MLNISGLMVIPKEPAIVCTSAPSGGFFISFKGVTETVSSNKESKFNYWNCSVYVPDDTEQDKWIQNYLEPGNVLYIEHAAAISLSSPDGKYYNTKIQLDRFRVKKLEIPFWVKG